MVFNAVLYGAIFLSLFLVDYILGNGFLDIFHTIFVKCSRYIQDNFRDEFKVKQNVGEENPISLPVLVTEIVLLSLTIAFLNKYKRAKGKDRIDELLQESKDALRQTNEFLEKWRLRRVPTEYSYLDEEPQQIKPLKLEVPLLHMAIVDTLGTTRSQLERGDAGDTINFTDSTLLSMTSLLEGDMDIVEPFSDVNMEENMADYTTTEVSNRYLWDLVEEDGFLDD